MKKTIAIYSVFIGVTLFLIILWGIVALKKEIQNKEYIKFNIAVQNLNTIGDIISKGRNIQSLYQIYRENDSLALQFFTSAFSSNYDEAIYWDTKSLSQKQRLIVPQDVFDRICRVVMIYNENTPEIYLYNKDNAKIQKLIKLSEMEK
ncbi:MAG: hypothetical protein HPZ91_00010 [Lentisphaeria bacterium]|nr:hypothetical protein [Lentisphaeria bacterium]